MSDQKPKQYLTARRKHHIIYKTTCTVTGRYYIGMHSTDNLADGYLGSGKRLWQSVKKHGAENHQCEILEHLPSREALRIREEELVNKELIEDKQCMNLALGGTGDWGSANAQYTSEMRRLRGIEGGLAVKALSKLNKAIFHPKSDEGWKRLRASQLLNVNRLVETTDFKVNSKLGGAAAAKVLPAFWKRHYEAGGKNAMQDKRWVNKGDDIKLIEASQLESLLAEGYSQGKTPVKSKPKTDKYKARLEEYKMLRPVCRNAMCDTMLTYAQHFKGSTSCSKACSNITR